jgi:hypothetical protein
VKIREIIQRAIHRSSDGVDIEGRVNAAIAANVGEGDKSVVVTSSSSSDPIVQTSRRSTGS